MWVKKLLKIGNKKSRDCVDRIVIRHAVVKTIIHFLFVAYSKGVQIYLIKWHNIVESFRGKE